MKKEESLDPGTKVSNFSAAASGSQPKKIAGIIGKDKSIVSRELRRNRWKHGYHPGLAQEMADERKERFRR